MPLLLAAGLALASNPRRVAPVVARLSVVARSLSRADQEVTASR
ncbi:hypothetical protein [Mycobacterium leprae]|nr:hypothetical protein [Mycobacterium leprae]